MELEKDLTSRLSLTGNPTITIHATGLGISDKITNLITNNSTVFVGKFIPEIKKVIFQKTHTIVLWKDGERTVVNCSEENFDKEKGLAMAICKKYMKRNEFKRLIKDADIQDK